jgi:predicted flap endonuclease-1-like 5' DNA nuclease
MMDSDDDTTIGTGGWILVVISGVVAFVMLSGFLQYHFVPAGLFSVALALIVLLLLFRLAEAVNRYDDEEEASRVRKVVPSDANVGARISGTEGAAVQTAMAVPVRPEIRPDNSRTEAGVAPLRPSSTVRPLSDVEAAPVIQPISMAITAEVPVDAPKTKSAGRSKAKVDAKPKTVATVKSKAAAKPKAEGSTKPKGTKAKPTGLIRLTAARDGKADDLQEIEGIGPALEKLVNSLGFYHFDQIAGWTDTDVALVDAEMKNFKGRIARDKWVEQARIIVADGLEAFRERARANDY